MSLSQRTQMRRCGHRFATEEDAARHKLALNGSRVVVPCTAGCGGWHHEDAARPAPPKRSTPKDTGPDRATRAAVLARDGYACARCGKPCGPGIAPYSLQHRIARGVGGGSEMSNLIVLCGSATTLCHGEVESRAGREDNARGYWLQSWQGPLAEGVMYHERDGSGVTKWLEDDGGLLDEPPIEGAA